MRSWSARAVEREISNLPLMGDWSRCGHANGLLPVLLCILVEVEVASLCDLSEIWIGIMLRPVEGCELVARFQETWVMGMESVPSGLTNGRE
jgi:hypothetical protein